MRQRLYPLLAVMSFVALPALAETLVDHSADSDTVQMYEATEEGRGKYLGSIDVYSSEHGIVFDPALNGLEPGLHGFHVHEDATCEPNEKDPEHQVVPAGKAGDHLDPRSVDTHGGPWGIGHLGDLPNLYVDEDGKATQPVLAPRLEWEYLRGSSLMIHANPDDYETQPSGNSGPRIACGIFFTEEMDNRVGP